MKNKLFGFTILLAIFAFSGIIVFPQETSVPVSSLYVISAKAGGINYIDGNVSVARKAGGQAKLAVNDQLEVGDRLITGADGRVEVLLSPGSYLRLAENSEFEFISTNLDLLKARLSRGSGLIEAITDYEAGFEMDVDTPNGKASILKSGVYRINVSDGATRVEVWKGSARIEGNPPTLLKGGQIAIASAGRHSVEKLNKGSKDALYGWSKQRSKELARINSKLNRNVMAMALIGDRGVWNIHNSIGVWVFDKVTRQWCFLPFGWGWRSPFGYDYGLDIWGCRIPRYIIYDNPLGSGGGPVGGGSTTVAVQQDRRLPNSIPPFQKMQESQGGRGETPPIFDNSGSSSGGSSSPRSESENKPRYDSSDNKPAPRYDPPPSPKSEPPPPPPPSNGKVKDN